MTDNLEELERLPVDSGMDAATVEKAEWLWTHFPILTRWHTQPTYVKALVCRAIRKIEADATARKVEGLRAEVARLREALEQIAAGALPCTTAKTALEGKEPRP